MEICVEGTSFVHCHLMECNSRWNKRMTYKKGQTSWGKIPRFISQIKEAGSKLFYLKTMGVKICKICKITCLIVAITLKTK